MALKNNLGYEFTGKPPWREDPQDLSVPEILEAVAAVLKSEAEKAALDQLEHLAAAHYVHRSNKGESVGTQVLEETRSLIDSVATSGHSLANREKRETVNTYRALLAVKRLKEEMGGSGLLTVQQVCRLHEVVLEGLHPTAGKIRTCTVFTHSISDGTCHIYPSPDVLETRFFNIIDHHNIHMEILASTMKDRDLHERLKYVFKCASWLMFKFVSLHPFADGNGRTCRLLASYVLQCILPFPVSAFHDNQARNVRSDYIDAIVHCRNHPDEGPSLLASLLVEGAYLGLRELELLEGQDNSQSRNEAFASKPIREVAVEAGTLI